MKLGYNTNGFANHDPIQAIELLVDIGFRAIGLTVDHCLLNPVHADRTKQLRKIGQLIDRYDLSTVIESGARYLLNPGRKHFAKTAF